MMFAIQTAVQHRFQRLDVDKFFFHSDDWRLPLDRFLFFSERIFFLETTTTPQEWAVIEHTIWIRIECPVAAFARFFVVAWNLHEALVQTEIVTDGILPALLVVPVVRKLVHDVLIDAVQRDFAIDRCLDGHCNQCDVGVRRLHHFFILMRPAECVWRRISESRERLVRIMRCRLHCGLAGTVARLAGRIMTKRILIGEHCNRCGVHFRSENNILCRSHEYHFSGRVQIKVFSIIFFGLLFEIFAGINFFLSLRWAPL